MGHGIGLCLHPGRLPAPLVCQPAGHYGHIGVKNLGARKGLGLQLMSANPRNRNSAIRVDFLTERIEKPR